MEGTILTNSEHSTMETLFSNLDRWRHFAGYPLEARVDALFGLFLPKVIEDNCGVKEMHPEVVPQFPLKETGNNQSNKVDFFALSRDGGRAFLIELKTDMASRTEKQHEYLSRAREKGMACILSEFKTIAGAKGMHSNRRKKYFHLISALSEMGLLGLSKELEEKIRNVQPRSLAKFTSEIEVRPSTGSKIEVIFVQPKKDDSDGQEGFRHIYFHEFANSIQSCGELGRLFASYLGRWKTDPGRCTPKKA